MKVLFLDVDGVLNNDKTKERINGFIGLDETLVQKFLDWKNKHPEVNIVLSSTWRLDSVFTSELKQAISTKGVHLYGQTPHLPYRGRGGEIAEWLANNENVTHFAILDDTKVASPLQENLVLVEERIGLRDQDLEQVNKLLDLSL